MGSKHLDMDIFQESLLSLPQVEERIEFCIYPILYQYFYTIRLQECQQTFSIKSQMVNIFDFVGQGNMEAIM